MSTLRYNDENWFKDNITWYVNHDSADILSLDLPLFTKIYTVFDSEVYNTYSDLQRLNSLEVFAYSVERPAIDTIILTCRYTPGTPTVQSLALVTSIGNSLYLIAKISRFGEARVITNGVDRVFKFKLPYKVIDNIKVYPNISLRSKCYSNTPIGEEFVTTGEHHHNVDWGGAGARDAIPVLPQSSARYVASASYNIQDGFAGTSYVFNESGGNLNSKFASIAGKRVTSLEDADVSGNPTSRIIDTVTNILANIMEEYLMATNSIQILGHEIPTEASLNPSTGENYVLYVDKVAASNDRRLKAITSANLRSWLVKRIAHSTESSESLDSCLTIIDASADVTNLTMSKNSSVAFVVNNKSSITASINVYVNGGSATVVHPKEALIVTKDSSGNYQSLLVGSTAMLKNVLSGNVCFSKISLGTAASTPTEDTPYLSFNSDGIGFKGSITTDINASGHTVTAGTISTGNLGVTTLSATKVYATQGFYIGSPS